MTEAYLPPNIIFRGVFRGGRTGARPLNSAKAWQWDESLKFGQLTLGKIIKIHISRYTPEYHAIHAFIPVLCVRKMNISSSVASTLFAVPNYRTNENNTAVYLIITSLESSAAQPRVISEKSGLWRNKSHWFVSLSWLKSSQVAWWRHSTAHLRLFKFFTV